jgi:hypothetical protein
MRDPLDPLWEARFAQDLLWRIRGGALAHDDELERAAKGVATLIDAYLARGERLARVGFSDERVEIAVTDDV